MIVAIGTEGYIFGNELSLKISNCLWGIVDIHERLWNPDGITDTELVSIDESIRHMLNQFKSLWGDMSKSDCRFPKFHYTLHLTHIVRTYGSLRVIDTCVGESKNKDVKKIYRRTNKKKTSLECQMFNAMLMKQQLCGETGMVKARSNVCIHMCDM
jgi:hypothetical protein